MRSVLLRHAIALALLAAVLEPTVACTSCTLVGCGSGLDLDLAPAGPRFANGTYRLTWVADDADGECEFEIADDERCPEWQPPICVVEPTCASAFDDGSGRIGVQLDETPETLQVTLERGDDVVLDRELTPAYDVSQPNGPGCDPVCTQATMELATAG